MEHRVYGPPGTGKSTYLARQISRVTEREGPNCAIVCSFTRAAAAELASRDLGSIDHANVGTLHALAYRALGGSTGAGDVAEGKAKEFTESSKYRIERTMTMEEGAVEVSADNEYQQYMQLRAQRRERDTWPASVLTFAREWEQWKASRQLVDFTDMIEICFNEGVPPPEGVRYGFFDEVQDFTPLELALVRQWAEQLTEAVFAGDDDQCIYDFKGATPEAFLNPPVPEEQERVLPVSHRLPLEVWVVCQDWVQQISARKDKQYDPRDELGSVERPPLYLADGAAVARAAHEAEGTSMILTSAGYMLHNVLKHLRLLGIPFHNPYRLAQGEWNPLPRRRDGKGLRGALTALLKLNPEFDVAGAQRAWTFGDVQQWGKLIKKEGVFSTTWKSIAEREPDEPFDMSLLSEGTIPWQHGNELAWLAQRAASGVEARLAYPRALVQRAGVRAIAAEPSVVVGTIHSVKGGEADNVFLFPDLSPAAYTAREQNPDSVTRTIYVGMSRARQTLNLCRASTPRAIGWRP